MSNEHRCTVYAHASVCTGIFPEVFGAGLLAKNPASQFFYNPPLCCFSRSSMVQNSERMVYEDLNTEHRISNVEQRIMTHRILNGEIAHPEPFNRDFGHLAYVVLADVNLPKGR